MNHSDADDWTVHTGTYSHRYPYWIGRQKKNSSTEYVANDAGDVKKFASRDAAQKIADQKNVALNYERAREYQRLAVHYMLRATDHLQPTSAPAKKLLPLIEKMTDNYLALTGYQL